MKVQWVGLLGCCLGTVARAADEDGRLVVIVFEVGTGRPIDGAAVRVGEREVGRTDRRGSLRVDLPPGVAPVSVLSPAGAWEPAGDVRIGEGLTSEILVTWFADGRTPTALTEQPSEQLATAASAEDGPVGTLRGRVVSSEDGKPIVGARVFVRGSRADARTDADGVFILRVPAGPRDLSIIHDKYATQAVNNVAVLADQEVPLSVELVPAGLALEDFTVRAPRIEGGTSALLDERRTSSAVGDVLGAEQMARSGDSSAASALRRVTGLTLVGGKYVYVRGLGERYSSTLLNGATLPSPEPEQRVVPLDMFPSGILEGVVIQKTFSPDMPGEFGGGSIQLRTRNIPTEPVLAIGLSGGYNSITTFRTGLDYEGGAWDWLGAGAPSRALPPDILAASQQARIAPSDRFCEGICYTSEDLEAWGESFPNIWNPEERSLPPDLGLSMTAGTGSKTALFGRPAGVLWGLSYGNQWRYRDFRRGFYALGAEEALELTNEYNFQQTNNQVTSGNIIALGFSPAEGSEIRSTSLALRIADDEVRYFDGFNQDEQSDIRVTRLRYVESQLLVQQLSGSHRLWEGGPTWTWRGSLAQANRKEPNRRGFQYNQSETGEYAISDRAAGNQRFYSYLTDRNRDLGSEVSIPLGPEVGEDKFRFTLRIGGMAADKERDVETRRFQFLGRGPGAYDFELNQKDPESIFVPDNIAPDAYQFEEITLPTDNYQATHRVRAGYLMAEAPFFAWLRVMAGARYEFSDQEVTTYRLFDEDLSPIGASIATKDLLPATTITISPDAKSNIRLGWGRTVSRPDFREMSPAPFDDIVGGRNVLGNPELVRAVINNLDVRYELYPSDGETISVAGFYKDFTDPVEAVLRISSERSVTWENAKGAWLAGLEFDARKSMAFVDQRLQDVYVGGNLALIRSRVDLSESSGVQTSVVRALQGQSPYVVNLSVGYDNPETGTYLTALYNVYGPRIVEAGAFGQPDTYDLPVHTLDVVAAIKLPEGFKAGLKVGNILNWPSAQVMRDTETERILRGWDLGLRLSWGL